jgi:hypothetical protein
VDALLVDGTREAAWRVTEINPGWDQRRWKRLAESRESWAYWAQFPHLEVVNSGVTVAREGPITPNVGGASNPRARSRRITTWNSS